MIYWTVNFCLRKIELSITAIYNAIVIHNISNTVFTLYNPLYNRLDELWKYVFPAFYLWVSVKRTYREPVEATNQSWCPEILIQPACGAGMEQLYISTCCGSYVCEPVQEQIGQVLAKIWALKLNSTENYGRRCLTPLSPHRNYILS